MTTEKSEPTTGWFIFAFVSEIGNSIVQFFKDIVNELKNLRERIPWDRY